MHVGASDEQVREWNNARISISSPSPSDNDNKNCYTPAHLDELIMRYEEPDSKNRWDAPLFTVLSAHDADFNNGDNPGDEGTTTTTTTTTAAEIFAFLTDGSMAKKPKFSTVVVNRSKKKEDGRENGRESIAPINPQNPLPQKPLTEATYLTDLDQITADILTVIQTTQRNTSSLSSSITAASPHSSLHLHLPSRLLSLPELRRLRRQYTQMNKMHTRIGSGKIADGFIMFLNSSFEKD